MRSTRERADRGPGPKEGQILAMGLLLGYAEPRSVPRDSPQGFANGC
ncbi:MAG: hypothetical protein VX293_04975 [Candidatus Latescibacterota bacterium]|nr:hypothetical protein [Candidatus Latescibacterota bacterium]